jgi:class 3 adenylate cyclase/esterase/lipase
MSPRVKYAMSDDVAIAYCVTGEGPLDLVFAPGFISHIEHYWEQPRHVRFFNELSSFTRLINFDKRGTGLSDRHVRLPNMDERIDDIRAVMDAAGSKQAVLLGVSEGGAMCTLFAATYPNRVSKLILMGSYANAATSVPELAKMAVSPKQIRENWGTGAMLPLYAPGLAKDPDFVSWFAKYERLSASPSAVIELRKSNAEIDVSHVLPSIQAPTLVLHATGDVRIKVEAAREMAAAIPNSKIVEFPGEDHMFWLHDPRDVIDEIRNFVGATPSVLETDRVLSTVMFTDLVDSTQAATSMGDVKWRSVLETHFTLARNEIERFRGREVKTLGDGILATFDGPGRAVKCAWAITQSMKPLGVGVRAGLHTGEIEIAHDGDIGGIAVNMAARISQQAERDEVLVSRTVKDLVAGSDINFADLGNRALKGIDEPMRIYRVKI